MKSPADPAKVRVAVLERAEVFRAAEKPQEPAVEDQPRRAFRFLSLAEVLRDPQPTDWLLRGYLEAETLACLFGESGAMKSFVALDMGLCIASGLPWHGVDVPKSGPVLYVAGEGFKGLSKRIQAWLMANHLSGEGVPFHVASEAVQFLDSGSLEAANTAIVDLAEIHGNPRLVIIDTLARCYGRDENSTEDMSAFIAVLDRLRARFGCAVLVVHHSGLASKDRSRGSTALRAALDWEYRLEAQEDTRILSCTKTKDHDAPADLAFEADTMPTGWTDSETGAPIGSLVLRKVDAPVPSRKGKALPRAQRVAMEALAACCESEGRTHIEVWRKEAYRRGITPSEDASAKRKAFSRAASSLLESGLIETENDLYWATGHQDKAGQTGHVPPMSPCPERDGQGHPSLEGVPCPAPQGTLPMGKGEEAA